MARERGCGQVGGIVNISIVQSEEFESAARLANFPETRLPGNLEILGPRAIPYDFGVTSASYFSSYFQAMLFPSGAVIRFDEWGIRSSSEFPELWDAILLSSGCRDLEMTETVVADASATQAILLYSVLVCWSVAFVSVDGSNYFYADHDEMFWYYAKDAELDREIEEQVNENVTSARFTGWVVQDD
jgi:hypothetical protein